MTPLPGLPLDRRALIAVDLGAESCRVSLLQRLSDTLQPPGAAKPESHLCATLVHRFPNAPVTNADGSLHWPLTTIEQGILEGLRRCATLAPEGIRSIAIDGWAVDYARLASPSSSQVDPFCLNDNATEASATGEPFCYRDDRTLASEQHIHSSTSLPRLRALAGIQVQRINTAYQLAADRLAGLPAARWLNLPEYLLHRLGGRPVAELTNASHTQLVEVGCACWSHEAFDHFGLDPKLAPPIVPPGTVLGTLRGPLTLLPALQNTTLIAPACHDTASAIAGIPVASTPDGDGAGDDGWQDAAYISSGTWSLVGTVLNAPENGPEACAGNYTNLAAAGGRTLFHKGLNGMWLLRQCLQHWAAAPPGEAASTAAANPLDLETLIAQAAMLPPPQHLLSIDAPDLLLHGDMPGRISRQLVLQGAPPLPLTADAGPRYANLIFHSLAARYATVLREIESITGKHLRRIYVVGGASRNRFLNGLIEQATGLSVVRGPAESSTHGNFAIQLAVLEQGEATAPTVAHWARVLDRELEGELAAPPQQC